MAQIDLATATAARKNQIQSNLFGPNGNIVRLVDSIERKTLSSYILDGGPVIGRTRVIQSNMEGILWNLIGSDVTIDASWIGVPYTVDPDGAVIVSMELANVSGTVPNRNTIGASGGVISIGDGYTTNGRKVMMNDTPDGMVKILYTGGSDIYITCSTDNVLQQHSITARQWDGKLTSDYRAGFNPYVTLTVPLSGNWSKSSPKEIFIWSCVSVNNATLSGNITLLRVNNTPYINVDISRAAYLTTIEVDNNKLTTLDVSNNPQLTHVYCGNNKLTTLDVSNNPQLTHVYCNNNLLTTLDVSNKPQLFDLSCNNNLLTTLDVSNKPQLYQLNCYNNLLTTLDVSNNPQLYYLFCYNNLLTTLDFSGLSTLYQCNVSNNPTLTNLNFSTNNNLQSIIAYNCGAMDVIPCSATIFGNSAYDIIDISGSLMSSIQLNSFFSKLPNPIAATTLDISGCLGLSGANLGLIPPNWNVVTI